MNNTIFTAGGVADELEARLKTIRIADNFETDIGRDVAMGRRKIPGDDQPPCLQVLEGLDDVRDYQGRNPMVLTEQQFVISGFDKCDPDQPNKRAHAMIRDIKKAVFKGPDGSTWGGKVKQVRYLGKDIGPRPDGVALVQAQVLIAVQFVEDMTQP